MLRRINTLVDFFQEVHLCFWEELVSGIPQIGCFETLRTRLLSSQRSCNKYISYDQKKFFLQNEYKFKKDLYFICNANIFCVKIYF